MTSEVLTMGSQEATGPQVLPQIVLVEDAEFQAEVTMLALAQADPPPDVRWFANAQDAIDFLVMQGAHAQRPPGVPLLVLSDVHLPNVSGLELLKRIRPVPQLCGLPIVMMSAAASADEVALLSTVGFWLHVNRFPDDWRRRSAGRSPR